MKLSLPLTSALSLVGRQRLSMVAISCRRAYHVCSNTAHTARAGDMLKTAATRRGHRLLLFLRQDDHQLTTHCYTVGLHAVRRYSGASDGGRHDGPITVAAHERVTVPPPPITLPVLDGTVIDALFEGKKSINHKQVRLVLDGYDMRAMTFRDATHLMHSASNCRHRLRPQQLKQINAALRKASGAEITTTGSELVDLAYSLRVYEYDYCDAIKEIIELIAMRLQDSFDKLSGQQVAMALNGLNKMSSEHAEVIWLRSVVIDARLSAYRDGNTTTATSERAVKQGEEWLL